MGWGERIYVVVLIISLKTWMKMYCSYVIFKHMSSQCCFTGKALRHQSGPAGSSEHSLIRRDTLRCCGPAVLSMSSSAPIFCHMHKMSRKPVVQAKLWVRGQCYPGCSTCNSMALGWFQGSRCKAVLSCGVILGVHVEGLQRLNLSPVNYI